MELLDEIKLDYFLFKDEPKKYQDKVDSVSELFSLKENDRLLDDISPAYLAGKYYEKEHFVIFGINPGYITENDRPAEKENKKSWDHYWNHHLNFYRFFGYHELVSNYYEKIWLLFCGLMNYEKREIDWSFFDSSVTNLNLIPYHSRGISIPSTLSDMQLAYLKTRLQSNLKFITKYSPKMFIFNGNPWYTLLIKHKIIKKFKKIQITKKFNLYLFEFDDVPCVLFDKFFSSHFWQITDHHRKSIIPNCIRKEYPNVEY